MDFNLEIVMASGTADKVKGTAKEVAGKVTGDKRVSGVRLPRASGVDGGLI